MASDFQIDSLSDVAPAVIALVDGKVPARLRDELVDLAEDIWWEGTAEGSWDAIHNTPD